MATVHHTRRASDFTDWGQADEVQEEAFADDE